MTSAPAPGPEGLVLRVSGPTASVMTDGAEVEVEAALPPKLAGGPVVAGDRVALRRDGDGVTVVAIAPRRTVLERGDGSGRRRRVLVANADLVVIVAAVVDPPLRPRLIDRYLVAAAAGGLAAAVVVTKTDLPHDAGELARFARIYEEIGHPVVTGSAKGDELAGRVRGLIGGRIAVLAGHSGVGKSTLTSAITGVPRATGAVSGKARTGRHTTSDPRLIPIPGGGAVVDTAGVRTFHLPPMGPGELADAFPEIRAAAGLCRFRGCRHDGDAGCAVVDRISPERLDSYHRLVRLYAP